MLHTSKKYLWQIHNKISPLIKYNPLENWGRTFPVVLEQKNRTSVFRTVSVGRIEYLYFFHIIYYVNIAFKKCIFLKIAFVLSYWKCRNICFFICWIISTYGWHYNSKPARDSNPKGHTERQIEIRTTKWSFKGFFLLSYGTINIIKQFKKWLRNVKFDESALKMKLWDETNWNHFINEILFFRRTHFLWE